jgi:hypothetical protein
MLEQQTEELNNIKSLDLKYNPKKLKLDLKDFIVQWNNRYPWDLWWRNRYKVGFGTSQHKEISHVDMLMEYIEYRHIEQLKKQREEDEENAENESIGITKGDNKNKMSKKAVDKAFDDLNLDEFNNLEEVVKK